MLTDVLYQNWTQPWITRWLRRVLPAKPQDVEIDENGALKFSFRLNKGKQLAPVLLSSGRCVKLLQRASPADVALLLFRLCCLYDRRQETSQLLRKQLTEQLGCRSEPAFFYWSDQHGGALTTIVLKGRRRQSPNVNVLRKSPLDEDAFYCVLPPSEWLCDVLLQHLVSQL